MIALVLIAVAAPFALLGIFEGVHPLAREVGMTNASGQPYLFWSGFFGDVTIFVAAALFVAHHNCRARWCPRIGRHTVDGTPYVVCQRHHPDHSRVPSRPTFQEILRHHARATNAPVNVPTPPTRPSPTGRGH